MHKPIAIVNQRSPYGEDHAHAAMDAGLAFLALEHPVSWFFLADGVWQLLKQPAATADQKASMSQLISALPHYEVKREQLIVCADSLIERGLHADQLCLRHCLIVNKQVLAQQLYAHDLVISF